MNYDMYERGCLAHRLCQSAQHAFAQHLCQSAQHAFAQHGFCLIISALLDLASEPESQQDSQKARDTASRRGKGERQPAGGLNQRPRAVASQRSLAPWDGLRPSLGLSTSSASGTSPTQESLLVMPLRSSAVLIRGTHGQMVNGHSRIRPCLCKTNIFKNQTIEV